VSFYTVMNQVVVIFIITIIGVILKKLGYIDKQISKGITEILLNVAIPALIISSFNTELPGTALTGAGMVFGFGVLNLSAAAVLGYFLFRKYPASTRAVMSFIAVFTNCGFMGYPVMGSIFGSIGVFYTSIYGIVFNIFLWTYGQIIFTGVRDRTVLKQALFNPGNIAVVIGLALLLTPLELPAVLAQSAEMVGALTTPLAMIVIGAMLAEVKLNELFTGFHIYYATILRLAIFPALAFVFLKTLGADPQIIAVCTLFTAMPAASNTVLFTEKFAGDSLLASRIVALSTALSIITVPVVAVIII